MAVPQRKPSGKEPYKRGSSYLNKINIILIMMMITISILAMHCKGKSEVFNKDMVSPRHVEIVNW